MLTIYRRHVSSCPHKTKGRSYLKCNCPLWADGYADRRRSMRVSLGTRDVARARRKAMALEDPKEQVYKEVPEAIADFLRRCESEGLSNETIRKYRNSLKHLGAFCGKKIGAVSDMTVETLDVFRASRKLKPITALKELQLLRQFCGFCKDRGWMEENIAKRIKTPRNIKPNDIEPFTQDEIDKIIKACERIGRHPYERLRAKAMILAFRYTALRISDVAMLQKGRISQYGDRWRIFLRASKNGQPVFLPIPQELKDALDLVPKAKNSKIEGYYFWNGVSTERSMKKNADDTLRAVFRKSEVHRAHAHRFRHTLATEMLGMGASFEEVADVLGNTPEVVREHYAKWSPQRQNRIDSLMEKVHSEAMYRPRLQRVK